MTKLILTVSSGQARRRSVVCAFMLIALGFMIPPSNAQVTSSEKYIYLSGQITESISGAPIPDYEIYILSDSLDNNGFTYYAVTKTDVNGFYWDTIMTTQMDGTLNLSLYDFEENLISIDRYYRFVWDDEFPMFVDFSIFNPNSNTEFQANFKAEEDTMTQNPMKVVFRDISIGPLIKGWEWDFGDGITSQVQDPEHIYTEPGNYLVTLTVSSYPISIEIPVTSTITKQVQVGLTDYYNIGGHVFAEYFPIDVGFAYLYVFDQENKLIPLDTTEIDTLGYYTFYQVPEGRYLTKARLDKNSTHYGMFVPTYYGNTVNWQQASIIELEDNDFELDITLIPSIGITSGQGVITGQINYDTLRSSSSIIPAEDVEIVLMNDRGGYLTCGLSDLGGYFGFEDLAFGTYQLFPDVTGIPTNPMFVTISEEEPTVEDLSLVINTEEIIFSINENNSSFIENDLLIYPNPVSDEARINIVMKRSSGIDIMIVDLAGRMVYNETRMLQKGSNQVELNLQNLIPGCYQVTIVPEDRVYISGKLLKIN
jgi:PKD repeat protein